MYDENRDAMLSTASPWLPVAEINIQGFGNIASRDDTFKTVSSLVASIMLPFVFNFPVINAFWPVIYPNRVLARKQEQREFYTFPSAKSNSVSSARIMVTSAFGWALPL